MNTPRTVIALLGGAAALSLAGAALAQAVAPATDADLEGPQAAIVEEDQPAAPATRQDSAAAAPGPGDIEGPQAAIVEEGIGDGADAAGPQAQDAPDAEGGAAPGPGHTNADRFSDDELAGVAVGAGSPEALAAEDPAQAQAAAAGAAHDARLLDVFMEMDTDGDLLLTQAEFAAWQGWDAGRPPAFADLDANGAGLVGFGEYRAWSATYAGTAPPRS